MLKNNLIFKWSIGDQDTVTLSTFNNSNQFNKILWLCKLSILSFQKWFGGSQFYILYNGNSIEEFKLRFLAASPNLIYPVVFIDQTKLSNPYHFTPKGVWYKWIPFKIDKSCTEIAIDTDIICISEPFTWYEWINNTNEDILVAPERYENVIVNTCGDFYNHPLLKNKTPINCGIVGTKSEFDGSKEFYQICQSVKFGETHNSMFITEQGAINLWARTLEHSGSSVKLIDYKKNAWIRDFLFFMYNDISVETIHCTSWHKEIAWSLKNVFEQRIMGQLNDKTAFISLVLKTSKHFSNVYKHTIFRQIVSNPDLSTNFLIK